MDLDYVLDQMSAIVASGSFDANKTDSREAIASVLDTIDAAPLPSAAPLTPTEDLAAVDIVPETTDKPIDLSTVELSVDCVSPANRISETQTEYIDALEQNEPSEPVRVEPTHIAEPDLPAAPSIDLHVAPDVVPDFVDEPTPPVEPTPQLNLPAEPTSPAEPGLVLERNRVATRLAQQVKQTEDFISNRPAVEAEREKAENLREAIRRDEEEIANLRRKQEAAEQSEQKRLQELQTESTKLLGQQQSLSQQREELLDSIRNHEAEVTRLREQQRASEQSEQKRLQKLQSEAAELQSRQQVLRQQREELVGQVAKQEQLCRQQDEAQSQQIAQLRSQTQSLQTEIESAQRQLETLSARSTQPADSHRLTEQLQQLASQRDQVVSDLQAAKLNAGSRDKLLDMERQQHAQKLDALQAEISRGQQQLQQLRETVQTTPDDSVDRSARILKLTEERDQLAAALQQEQQTAEEQQRQQTDASVQQQKELEQLQQEVVAGVAKLKEIRRARSAALSQPAQLDEELNTARTNHQRLQEHIQRAGADLKQLQSEKQTVEARQSEIAELKAKVEADQQKLQQAEKARQQIADEIRRLASLTDVPSLKAEHKETRKQLSAARELLARFRQKLKLVRQRSVEDQTRSVSLGGEIRSDLQATREVLDVLLHAQHPAPEATTDTLKQTIPPKVDLHETEESGESEDRDPSSLDFAIGPKPKKAISPVRHAVLEPYEGPDEDELEFGESPLAAPTEEYSADRGRQPGSFQMTLVSCGLGLIALATVATVVAVAMWLYAAFENGTQVADALKLYLPLAKIGVPAAWGLGSILCLFTPRIVGARMESLLALLGIATALGASWYWWHDMTSTAWITISISGVLYAYLLQSFLAELCSFGGFHTCEQICEKMMGVTTFVAVCVVGLGIAWYVRVEPQSLLWGIQVAFLAGVILCVGNAVLIGRVILNIAAEQSRGREWLLEHV